MIRKPLIFSLICILIVSIISMYVWLNLPDLEKYPTHWNARGEVDAYGSRATVGVMLLTFPMTVAFVTVLLYAIPKIEPLRENLEASRKAYNIVWIMTIGFLTFIGAVMSPLFMSVEGINIDVLFRIITIGVCLLFIGIGNVMGKVRQNYMFGIRTPWTLASELSWEKTHRLGGRAFVLGGIIPILFVLASPKLGMTAMVISIHVVILFIFVYSYRVWKSDPDKRR